MCFAWVKKNIGLLFSKKNELERLKNNSTIVQLKVTYLYLQLTNTLQVLPNAQLSIVTSNYSKHAKALSSIQRFWEFIARFFL